MIYRELAGRLAAGASRRSDQPPAVADSELQDEFASLHPARLLLLELVELSPMLLQLASTTWITHPAGMTIWRTRRVVAC